MLKPRALLALALLASTRRVRPDAARAGRDAAAPRARRPTSGCAGSTRRNGRGGASRTRGPTAAGRARSPTIIRSVDAGRAARAARLLGECAARAGRDSRSPSCPARSGSTPPSSAPSSMEQIGDVRLRTYEAPFNSDSFFWTYLAPSIGLRQCGGISPLYRPACATCRAISASISPICATGLARGFSRAARHPDRPRRDDRAVHRRRRDQPALRALPAHAVVDPGRGAGAAARRGAGGDARGGDARLSRSARASSARII